MGIEAVFNVKKYVKSLSKEEVFRKYAVDAVRSGKIDDLLDLVTCQLVNDFNDFPEKKKNESLIEILSPTAYQISMEIMKG